MSSSNYSGLVTPPLTLINGRLLVSPSQIELLKTCFRKWSFTYLHLREPNLPSPSRDGGKAMHAALEVLFKMRLAGASEATALALAHQGLHNGFAGITLPDDEYRTEARYAEVLDKYVEHWKGQGEEFTMLAVEKAFEVPLGSVTMLVNSKLSGNMAHPDDWPPEPHRVKVPVALQGIIDRIINWDRVTYVADTKTMNDWGPRKQDEWERAAAPKLYAYALNQLTTELNLPGAVQGFMLDAIVIRKPTTNARARLPREEFHRLRYAYTPEQLEEARVNALAWVQMAVDQAAAGSFLMNEQACANSYGRRCGFWDVCSVPTEQRKLVLDSDLYRNKERREVAKEVVNEAE